MTDSGNNTEKQDEFSSVKYSIFSFAPKINADRIVSAKS